MTVAEAVPLRPLLRGVLHGAGFVVALAVGVVFVSSLEGRSLVAGAVFAASAVVTLGTSTLYHRVTWSPRARPWMRRLDHAGVYLLIAGTYTPVGLLVLDGHWRLILLPTVWACAAAATIFKFVWVGAPKWLAVAFGITLGWAGVAALPQLATRLDPAAV